MTTDLLTNGMITNWQHAPMIIPKGLMKTTLICSQSISQPMIAVVKADTARSA